MAITVVSAGYSDHVAIKQIHYHNCHQLLFITRGTAQVSVNGVKHRVSAGQVVIFSHLEHHAVTNQSQDYQRYILEIKPDIPVMSKEGYRVYAILFNRPAGFSNILDVRAEQGVFQGLFEAICREMQEKSPMQEEMLDLLAQQLLISIYRQTKDAFAQMERDHFELVYQIQTLFHREFQKQFSLAELAQAYNISVSYLSHLFKTTTGSSVMGYLQSCRIAEAKKCLAETNMRIGEIVEHCGFSDSSNFSRTFRSITGLSPSDFRGQFHKNAQ